MRPFKKGAKVDFLSYVYVIEDITKTDVRMRRVGSKDSESVLNLKIGSKRFNKIFLSSYEGVYSRILSAEEILDVDIENKVSGKLDIIIFQDVIDSLRVDKGIYKSKTEATIWCLNSLAEESMLKEQYKNPLYAVLALYYYRTELTEVTEVSVEKYINASKFRDKFTNFFIFISEVLKGNGDVEELMTYIPDDYENIMLEFLLGRVQLNVTLKDLKYIIRKYERENNMAKNTNELKVFTDEEINKLSALFSGEAAARGLDGEDSTESDVNLAELLEDMEVQDVLDLMKEAGVTIRATKKTLELDAEALAELVESKLDAEQLETFMELLEVEEDEDADDADDEDEDDDADDEDEEGVDLTDLLEEALEENTIVEILENAGVEIKLNPKQKKLDAAGLAELLESKLDEDSMDSLLEYLSGDADDEDGEEEDAEDADLTELLTTVMESEDILDILENAGVEIKLNPKQKKFDAEAMAELLESKLDEDSMDSLLEYLGEYEVEEDEDEDADDADDEEDEDADDADEDEDGEEEDIDIDDLDDEEILDLAGEEGIKVAKIKGKVTPKELKRVRAELKAMYE